MNTHTVERVDIGAWVKVRGFVPGIDTVFHFVPENEVDYNKHRVSMKGPLWRALDGAEVGDVVLLKIGGETVKLEVLQVGLD